MYLLLLRLDFGRAQAYLLDSVTVSGSSMTAPASFNPPDTSRARAGSGCLWPPNHQLVEIGILGVFDPDGDPVTITISVITSDEPTASGLGSGGAKYVPDAAGIGTDKASVRAERSGNGDGRVYAIHFVAADDSGAQSAGSITVRVPQDQSAHECSAVDSGQKYDATAIN